MKLKILIGLALVMVMGACSILQPSAQNKNVVEEQPVEEETLEEVTVEVEEDPRVYQETERMVNDLIHTKLEVSFDWDKARLNGKATLDLKPYFYSVDSLYLDAKGFDLHKVVLEQGGKEVPLVHTYNGEIIAIKLNRIYNRNERYRVKIDYTAKPNERKSKGSDAITSDKGLYFIKPDEKRPNIMPQIWTQGETEASSCWFPTIDAPTEKMTQELYITVKEKYKTLSNGTLVYGVENGNGTRTDYWKQDLPHSPYLVMMAIGEFEVVKDSWRDSVEVHYYVEKPFKPYAKAIFGHTPEMMEFFSKLLGVDYVWDKYHQIVVRDYVSGAMENTSAVIHGDFLYQTTRELLDKDNESIIAHELFHHWFGDLVTCESWSNLPLNESFANYSQYLWDEYKYGKDEADYNGYEEMQGYLGEARGKQVNLIRYFYEDKEDMFDAHSYNKGGRILHMLRNFLGDDAFFASLKRYLEDNKFKTAEVHNLRLAFEEVTGYDLNWFFNQWFLSSGHPQLTITYDFDSVANNQLVSIEQIHNMDNTPLYRLPMAVDLYYSNGSKERKSIVVTQKSQEFSFKVPSIPVLVNVDADKVLLCEKDDQKPNNQWVTQYAKTPLYLDRYEALKACVAIEDPKLSKVLVDALDDKFWGIKVYAIMNIAVATKSYPDQVKAKLLKLAEVGKKTQVRQAALVALSTHFAGDPALTTTFFTKALKDSSYLVMGAGLLGLTEIDKELGLKEAKILETEKGDQVKLAVASVYASNGKAEQNTFFQTVFKSGLGAVNSYHMITHYKAYLLNQGDPIIDSGLKTLTTLAEGGERWWIKLNAYVSMLELQKLYVERIESIKESAEGSTETSAMNAEQKLAASKAEAIAVIIKGLLAKETDDKIIERIEAMLGT